MKSLAFQLIQRRITQILQQKYPDVRWIWENPYVKEDIFAGNKVYVILNRAGGYRRGLVLIRNLQVFDVVFEPVPEEESPQNPEPANPGPITPPDPNPMLNEDPDEEDEDIPEDYGLIAFSWVEANVLSLNDRINEAIARREEEILIPAEELPVKESWDEICKELTRNDVTGASCKENGILIEFEQ